VVLPGYTKEPGDDERFYELAENAARQALAIDPNIGEAHAVLAQINAGRGDLLDAESGFFFAISLEPNEATPHQWYSILLQKVGRLDAALAQAKRAQELDPSSPIIAANLATVYLVKGDEEQALHYSKLAADLGLSRGGTDVEAAVALRRGQWSEAKRFIAAEEGLPPSLKGEVARFVDAVADPALRPRVVASLRAIDPKVAEQTDLVEPYLRMGQVDLVYRILFESLDKDPLAWVHSWDLMHAWSPEGKALREDPRFGRLAERIGVIDYWKQYGYPDGCRSGTDAPIVCS
jgi:tetratricopeptide (TPR) repeat protein